MQHFAAMRAPLAGEGEGEGEGGSALAPTDVPFAVFPPTLLENVC
jgi:hypothetical protein